MKVFRWYNSFNNSFFSNLRKILFEKIEYFFADIRNFRAFSRLLFFENVNVVIFLQIYSAVYTYTVLRWGC